MKSLEIWTMRATGRQAQINRITSSRDVDTVTFSFTDDQLLRSVEVGQFVRDFVRVTKAPAKPDLAMFTLKRAAWAYGCAKKGSDEERQLLAVLLTKASEAQP